MAKKPISQQGKARKKPVVKKPPAGTLTERMGEVKNRPNKGLPARQSRARGNLNRASTPKEIRMGGQGGTGRSVVAQQGKAKFKPIPLGERPKMITGPRGPVAGSVAGTVAKGLFRSVGGPATMLVSMTTEAGSGSDKPVGKVRPGTATVNRMKAQEKGNPKTVNPYRKPASMAGGSKMKGSTQSGALKPSVSMAGGGVNRPESKTTVPKPKARPNKPATVDTSATLPKPKTRPDKPAVTRPSMEKRYAGMTFQEATRRNRTREYEMAKRKPKGNLLDFLKGRMKKR